MKKKKPKLFPVSRNVLGLFNVAAQFQLNADDYMRRYRDVNNQAFNAWRAENPSIPKNANLEYRDGVVTVLDK